MSKSIKEKLQAELSKSQPDPKAIAHLSDQLLDENKDTIRFSVDAQHIQRLGFELVGKQETALSELIKNSYDADASNVSIIFENYDKPGGKLLISDDGQGMNADTIKKAWMRLSTNVKIKSPISKLYGRNRAGKKGIGRFAVQRLGRKLTLETEVQGKKTGLRIYFKWDEDFKAGKELSSILNRIETYPKNSDSHGTKLIIDDLRDRWTNTVIDRVWKSVLLLQPPFNISKSKIIHSKSSTKYESDPGFLVSINGVTSKQQEKNISIDTSFLDHAIATIYGSIDINGKATFYVTAKKLKLDDHFSRKKKFHLTGPLALEARYFIYSSDLISGTSVRTASKMGQLYGGIRVYRDGFRVLPYGEPNDDWLKLAFDFGRRSLLIPASNNNFFGQISINRSDNILLEETSGREGLIENEAYSELQNFARECIEWAAIRVASSRERKQFASQRDFTSIVRKPSEVIEQVIDEFKDEISEYTPDKKTRELTKIVLEEAREEVREYEANIEKELEERIRYEAMLRILASLGLSISVFSHEVKGTSNAVKRDLVLLEEAISSCKNNPNYNQLIENTEAIKESMGKVFDLGGYISFLMSNTESRELKNISIQGLVEDFLKQFKDYIYKQKVAFVLDIDPPSLRTCKMHRSELDSVLFNFLTNSIKALRKANPKSKKIKITGRSSGKFVSIHFEDNGSGIPVDSQERIFDAFYTTSETEPEDEIAGTGTGLGLKIIRDIAQSYGGEVNIIRPSRGYKTCFEFKVLNNKA